MTKNNAIAIIVMFISFIIFEVVMYIGIKEKISEMQGELNSVKIEVEDLRKNQRLISQDSDLALRIAVQSAGDKDE